MDSILARYDALARRYGHAANDAALALAEAHFGRGGARDKAWLFFDAPEVAPLRRRSVCAAYHAARRALMTAK